MFWYIAEELAAILGSLIGGLIVMRAFTFFARAILRANDKQSLLLSSGIAALLIVPLLYAGIGGFTRQFAISYSVYLICTAFWYCWDLRKMRRVVTSDEKWDA